ncbi:MAG: indole-3-glycerol phosphate synthase TrpC [Eubacterium sp.]|nr:indole-3-glycerol phosphate synthase TrpC [Eubacterium sp.]MBR3173838.1 indole-3-glycerol phosphate synthase TrpC [Eubacterium sp.]
MILQEIAQSTRKRVNKEKSIKSLDDIKKEALALPKGSFEFEEAVKKTGMSFICEVKKASPSKGVIAQDFPYVEIAKDYEKAGASCISVLTEPEYFKGDKLYLKEISEYVKIPLIRKDFVVDEYMIYDAKVHGADCVLLICSLLDEDTIKEYISICDGLGISALVEAHDEEEIKMAINAGARMIGVNNRDLKTFTVDIENSEKLRKLVPKNILFVAESGIKTKDDVRRLKSANVNGVLIGETLMKSNNKEEMIMELDS